MSSGHACSGAGARWAGTRRHTGEIPQRVGQGPRADGGSACRGRVAGGQLRLTIRQECCPGRAVVARMAGGLGAAMYLGIDIGTSTVKTHPDGRGSAPSRRGLVGRHGGAAAASRLVRAGPGAVVGGRLRDAGRAGANASHRARGRARHRALGADVWGDAAGRVGPAGSAGYPVERHAGGRRVPRARGARAGASAHRAAPGDAGGDRAQARLGAPARTRAVPARADGAAAEGLCAAAADRREGVRPCGQLRHAVDGRGAAGVVGAFAGRDRAAACSHAGPGRGDRADGAAAPGGGGPLGA